MKVVNRENFLKLPSGTVYSKGKEWYFDAFNIKAESWDNDWVYLDLCWVECNESGQGFDRLQDSLENGTSYPMPTSYGRDGGFDKEDLFLIFEEEDLKKLRELIS